MTVREVLDGIKDRIADCRTYKFGMRNADKLAHEDAPRLTHAIEDVLRLHTSDGHKNLIGPYCEHCISPIDGGPALWPCPTVAAIEDALNPKEGQ